MFSKGEKPGTLAFKASGRCLLRRFSTNGQGVNDILKGIAQCCIHHAMPSNARFSGKTGGNDMHSKMSAPVPLHSGVSGMLCGLVLNLYKLGI